jgi:membrane protease YdiL (CAAX protease family)
VKRIIPLKHPIATLVGLAIALLGIPVFIASYRMISGENHSDWQVVVREIGIFLIVGVLLWIVQRKEVLPLSSIGWHTDALLRSFLRGLGLAAIVLAVTVGLYLLLQRAGVHLGEDHGNAFHPTLLVTTLIMLRAGVSEEIFYRGYAIERLQSLTGSKWLAGLVPPSVIRSFPLPTGPGRNHCSVRSRWHLHGILCEIPRSPGQHHGAFPGGFFSQRHLAARQRRLTEGEA